MAATGILVERMNHYASERIQAVCEALVASFNAAIKYNGLSVGLSDSFEILDYDPQSILVSVIPYVKEHNDPLKHVHLLLMEAFCKENTIRLLKMASMEGFCSLLKIVQMMDQSNPYSLDTSNTDATDLLIIKKDVGNTQQDEHFRSCYDALMASGSGTADELDEAVLTYGAKGRSVPVLPPLFPTFFDTTMWSTDVKER